MKPAMVNTECRYLSQISNLQCLCCNGSQYQKREFCWEMFVPPAVPSEDIQLELLANKWSKPYATLPEIFHQNKSGVGQIPKKLINLETLQESSYLKRAWKGSLFPTSSWISTKRFSSDLPDKKQPACAQASPLASGSLVVFWDYRSWWAGSRTMSHEKLPY